ncbi:hypothetical protein [Erythrobacter sp. BLCC-B19]|uniref:hypothetical protein n=1 Tax=Erythrobacter sp. BLCC-B19 TaxID=3025315 RepID=UPI0023616CED|nr:hypothetical protein [Erythrobacter sp. BLCC-B19]WDA42554.1 hypothetical protein PS060_07010 [Erythrobacter sp. BLCC-B19]
MRARIKALALAALVLLPGAVEAAGPCPVIGALLSENPKRLKGIGATLNGAGTFDVTMNGTADAVRGAKDCDLWGPAEEINISCGWNFEADAEADARRAFDTLKGRLEACLPTPLKRNEPKVYTEQELTEAAERSGASYADYLRNREVLADYDQSYPLDREEEVELDVAITLIRDREDGSIRMNVDLERD